MAWPIVGRGIPRYDLASRCGVPEGRRLRPATIAAGGNPIVTVEIWQLTSCYVLSEPDSCRSLHTGLATFGLARCPRRHESENCSSVARPRADVMSSRPPGLPYSARSASHFEAAPIKSLPHAQKRGSHNGFSRSDMRARGARGHCCDVGGSRCSRRAV